LIASRPNSQHLPDGKLVDRVIAGKLRVGGGGDFETGRLEGVAQRGDEIAAALGMGQEQFAVCALLRLAHPWSPKAGR
jgi:hypothetical protein